MSDNAKIQEIIAELCKSYWMELETVVNYLEFDSVNLDGVRAKRSRNRWRRMSQPNSDMQRS